MKVRPLLPIAGLVGLALALYGAEPVAQAAYTAQNAPDRTADGYPIVWLGNAAEPGSPTSDKDSVPDAFKRIRNATDNYVRFAKGADKRAYACYAGTAPDVTPTQLVEVRGREEGDGPKTTFRVNGWMVTCKVVAAAGAGAASLSSQPAPPANP
jgi:hypothetical protein